MARKHRDAELEKHYFLKTEERLARYSYAKYVERGSELDSNLAEYFPKLHAKARDIEKLSEVLEKFSEDRNTGSDAISVASMTNYMRSARRFIEIVGDKRMSDVTPIDINEYRKRRGEDKKGKSKTKLISPRTVLNDMLNVSVFFSWAYRNEHVHRNVFDKVRFPIVAKNPTKPPPLDLVDALSHVPWTTECSTDEDEWYVMQLVLRYTGCRLEEVSGIQAEWVSEVDGIPVLKVKAGKAKLRKKEQFVDGFKQIPIHPKLEGSLVMRARSIEKGDLFPNSGRSKVKFKGRIDIKMGKQFSREYLIEARKIYPGMKVHSWRSYVIHYLTKIAQVPEILSMDIVGHAKGSVHRDYAGVADVKTLYEVIKKLP